MNDNGFAGLEFCIVKKHVLDGAECNGGNGGAYIADAGRGGDKQAGGKVHQFLREAVHIQLTEVKLPTRCEL